MIPIARPTSPLTPYKRRVVAYHEAGHAIAALAIGLRVDSLALAPSADQSGVALVTFPLDAESVRALAAQRTTAALQRAAVAVHLVVRVAVAGNVGGRCAGARDHWGSAPCFIDRLAVVEYVNALVPFPVAGLDAGGRLRLGQIGRRAVAHERERARLALARHERELSALGHALYTRGSLSAEDVHELLSGCASELPRDLQLTDDDERAIAGTAALALAEWSV